MIWDALVGRVYVWLGVGRWYCSVSIFVVRAVPVLGAWWSQPLCMCAIFGPSLFLLLDVFCESRPLLCAARCVRSFLSWVQVPWFGGG